MNAHAQPSLAEGRDGGQRWLEWSLLGLGVVFFLVFCSLVSRARDLWADELLGRALLADGSFSHMVLAWKQGADGGGLPFYVLGRSWFSIFGDSTLSFRLFSSTAFAAAFVVTWRGARRFYSAAVVAVAMYLTWLCSWVILQESSEGRFYGLFLFAASTVFYFYARTVPERRISAGLLAGVFCSHAFLVSSHVLGIGYSGAFLLATVWSDVRTKSLRLGLYLSQAAAWLLLIPSWPAIKSTTDVGKPYFWLTKPHPIDLLLVWPLKNPLLVLALVVLAAVSLRRKKQAGGDEQRAGAGPLMAVLLAIPVVFFAGSYAVRPIFLDRYLIPVVIGLTLLAAELLTRAGVLRRRAGTEPRLLLREAAVCAAVAVFLLVAAARLKRERSPAFAEVLRISQGLPIVCEDAGDFIEMKALPAGAQAGFMYLLDWQNVLDPKSPRGDVTEYHLMEKWKDLGYESGSIEASESFLERTPAFYVFDAAGERWMANRVLGRAQFNAEKIGVYRGHKHQVTLWRVTRRG